MNKINRSVSVFKFKFLAWLMLIPLCAKAQPTLSEGLVYTVSNGLATITGYTGTSTVVAIPQQLGGYQVTEIGNHAFRDNKSIVSVSVPSGVRVIRQGAFWRCAALSTVDLPPSLIEIEASVFYECYKLSSITLPDSLVAIGFAAFFRCPLSSVFLPKSVTSIGRTAFSGSNELASFSVDVANTSFSSRDGVLFSKDGSAIIAFPTGRSGSYAIPQEVRRIEDFAFYHSVKLTAVVMNEGLLAIGQRAFMACSNLIELRMSSTVNNIADGALNFCPKLNSVLVPGENGYFEATSTALFTKATRTLLRASPNAVLEGVYVVPEGVRAIGFEAFFDCKSLFQIIFPPSVSYLNPNAFYGLASTLARILFTGSPPMITASELNNFAALKAIYYIEGTSGWSEFFAGYPTIVVRPPSLVNRTVSISLNERAQLKLETPNQVQISYQWFAGDSGETRSPVPGAISPLFLTPLLSSDKTFWARMTYADGFIIYSPTATVTVSATALLAVSQKVMAPGYTPGGAIVVVNAITYTGAAPSSINWATLLPTGWKYLGSGGGEGNGPKPVYESGDLIEWSWTTAPASPIKFTYMVSIPADTTGDQVIASIVSSKQNDTTYQTMAKPDPLIIKAASNHSADTNRDFKISLTELTRVIELYNYRSGTTRTGQYKIQSSTEDGFSPGP